MRFLYVFGLMFISIFGLVMLVKVLAEALKTGCTRRFDIYVKADDNIEEFLNEAKNLPSIGTVNIIVGEDKENLRKLEQLSEKYTDVKIVKEAGDNSSGYG